MGMLVVLPADGADLSLAPATGARLAELGVTSVAVLHDDDGHALVLEGWAFDAKRSAANVCSILAPGRGDLRCLRPLMDLAIAAHEGGALEDARLVGKSPNEGGIS